MCFIPKHWRKHTLNLDQGRAASNDDWAKSGKWRLARPKRQASQQLKTYPRRVTEGSIVPLEFFFYMPD